MEPYRKYLKCSNDHTTDRSSRSLVLYFCSLQFKNRLAHAMGCQLLSRYCSRQPPSPFLLASHLTRVGFVVSKCLFSIICVIAFLILINARSCWLVPFSFEPFMLFFVDNKGLRGAVNSYTLASRHGEPKKFRLTVSVWCIVCDCPVRDYIPHRIKCASRFSYSAHYGFSCYLFFYYFTMTDVLSPNIMLNWSGTIFIGEMVLRFCAVGAHFVIRVSSSESVSAQLDWYCMSNWGSESQSLFHIPASLSIACFSFFLSK